MNVCMIVYSGYEIDHRVRHYAEALAEKSARVDVISLSWEHGRGKRGTLEGVNIYRVREKMAGQKNPLGYLLSVLMFFLKGGALLLWRHIRHRYDIIHVHNMPDFLIFMGLLPKLLGAKLILDIHDVVPELYCQKFNMTMDSTPVRMLRLTEKVCVRFADYVIVANDLWKKKIIQRDGVDPGSCTGILNYPDRKYFPPIEGEKQDEYFTVIYPGTLSHHHGIDIAIKAIALAREKIPNLRLAVYGLSGDSNYVEHLEHLVESLNIQDRVDFHGPVGYQELNRVYARADIGVVPKRGGIFSSEAFSTKIFDFMAVGLPAVVSKTAIDEYYFDESNVLFFEPEKPEQLAQCMIDLYQDPGKRSALVANGKKYVEENNWGVKKSAYLDIVRKLTGNGQPAEDRAETSTKANRDIHARQPGDRAAAMPSGEKDDGGIH